MTQQISALLESRRYEKWSCQQKTRIDVYETLCPNRCLYIKAAKFRTGVGSAEMSHLQNCSLKIYLKRTLGGGGRSGWGVQDGCDEELTFFWGVRVDVNREVKFL